MLEKIKWQKEYPQFLNTMSVTNPTLLDRKYVCQREIEKR